MKTGTAVFLLFVVMFSAFAGFGYLFNQSQRLTEENLQYEENIQNLENELTLANDKLVEAQRQNNELRDQLTIAQKTGNNTGGADASVCATTSLPTSMTMAMTTPIAFLLLVVLGLGLKLRVSARRASETVTVQPSHEQGRKNVHYLRQK